MKTRFTENSDGFCGLLSEVPGKQEAAILLMNDDGPDDFLSTRAHAAPAFQTPTMAMTGSTPRGRSMRTESSFPMLFGLSQAYTLPDISSSWA